MIRVRETFLDRFIAKHDNPYRYFLCLFMNTNFAMASVLPVAGVSLCDVR